MALTAPPPSPARREQPQLPPLENGDHLDQATFHARYEAMPEDVRAELIGGIVFMSSPVRRPHGRWTLLLCGWLFEYEAATPGTEGLDNTTVILLEDEEPQPDVFLRILPECGGSTRDEDDYVTGPPELVIEVASSSDAIDMRLKKKGYEQAGVQEYLVVLTRPREVCWFTLRDGRYEALDPDPDGVFRSQRFPGLWLDPHALFAKHPGGLQAIVARGIATPEHTAFVARLAAARQSAEPGAGNPSA
jgi:Uma2 family endonuclease